MSKISLLALCATMTLSALANTPVPTLKGFGYGQQSAPNGSEWQAPEQYAHGKEQPHAYFFSFASTSSAVRVLPEHSEYYRSLDGAWQFHWVGHPDERPKDFYATDYNASSWDTVEVPMNWNVYGIQKNGQQKYGTPIYVNQPVIFKHEVKVDDWRGGVMRTPPQNWTTYKHRNEVGSYRRTFEIPSDWGGRAVYINFDGVDSFFYLWINGQYVGFSKNSRNLASFDITSYLRPGANVVAVEVYRSSDGSFLEAQDMFRLPGIYRSVYLTSKPQVQIRDLQIIPDLDAQYREGSLALSAELRNLSRRVAKDLRIDYSLYSLPLYSDQPTLISGATAQTARLKKLASGERTILKAELMLSKPQLWSAESPYRYLVVAELKDRKGRVLETVSTYTGFRKVEIKETKAEEDEFGLSGRYYYINGKTVKLKGVNRHETNPARGHAITREQMEQEVMIMKRANINHVRNSHYPTDPYFYYLCDKYGIYLEDEANIESHQYYYGKASLSHVPEFETAHTNRMLEMVYATINHPSIVIWSLGNEAGPGINFVKSYQATKAVDTSRPIQYERNNDIVDMGSNQYPSIPGTFELASGKTKAKYPFHISEYAHSMGNAVGGLEDYWKAIESTNFICGGAIWDWVDQALYNYTPEGKRYLAYGGDFGDTPNDGMFVMNGIVFADLSPKPQYYEVKKVYQYIGTELVSAEGGAAKIRVHNKNYYTDLSDYRLRWSILRNGHKVREAFAELPRLEARQRAEITIPYEVKMAEDPSGEYFLKLEYILAQDMPWAKAGYVQADEQLLLRKPITKPSIAQGQTGKLTSDLPTPKGKKKAKEQPYTTIEGNGFTAVFDNALGTIHSLKYGSDEVITAGNGPKLHLFRAPCDNDIWVRGAWGKNGLHNLQHRVLKSSAYKHRDGMIVLHFNVESQAPQGANLYDHRASGRYKVDEETDKPFGMEDFKVNSELVWSIYPDGSIELNTTLVSNKPKLALARLGYELVVPKHYSYYSYYGRGPINNYSDRKSSQFVEVHRSTVAEQFVNFPKPQTMGNREDVRWAALSNDAGRGLLVVAGDRMSTSALPWSQMELMMAPHPHQLPEMGDTHLHLDASVNGLGGASCGQGGPLDHCRSFAKPQRFSFIIRPYDKAREQELTQVSSLAMELPVLIDRDHRGMLTLSHPVGSEIKYTIDGGKDQTYTTPIQLRSDGEVVAWSMHTPHIKSYIKYGKIETVPLNISYVSSEEIHYGEGASNLIDQDPATFWHSVYSVTVAQYPHWIDFDMQEEQPIKGFTYLPRQDSENGRIKDYVIEVSTDGKTWTEVHRGSFDRNKDLKRVEFSVISARYVRFKALSSHAGNDFASGAEFDVISAN